ncbi:MAG: LysM peptidoglycan-binding domain-containing protein [Cephaloticoccus sp.]|nr:LysM peptidoglycan-binding domain-containing protein [Cephaloticoccus sp.]MCF7760404.1 LysM peptidoglycan-binding domain-containing protein [Cephaloticoccus sp.]
MWIRTSLGLLLTSVCAVAQGTPIQYEVANLREDVRGLVQKVGELNLRVEQLERENESLRSGVSSAAQSFATVTQLNDAVADLNRIIKAADSSAKGDVLQQVNQKLTALAKQTNAAIDSLAKGMAQRSVVQTTFSDDFSKEGVSYTVQKGDTISSIAQKNGARTQDILNANKIADPTRLQVGQTLFIPVPK